MNRFNRSSESRPNGSPHSHIRRASTHGPLGSREYHAPRGSLRFHGTHCRLGLGSSPLGSRGSPRGFLRPCECLPVVLLVLVVLFVRGSRDM